jgi:RHS repeat-associated protein
VDGLNRRVGKSVGGSLTEGFLYRDALNIVAQLDASGNVIARFVFGSKPNVPDYFTNAAGTFRILSDHLGSPRLVVNAANGSVAEEIDYDEFGNITNDTSPGLTPFGFAGGLVDKDTGLVRFGLRDYDPSTGRWTAKDPSRFRGGTNLYEYAESDPVNTIDPAGTGPITAAAVILICEAAAAYQLYSALDGLADYAVEIEMLKRQLAGADECERERIEQEVLDLSLKQAKRDLAIDAAETTFGLETIACLALGGIAALLPTP